MFVVRKTLLIAVVFSMCLSLLMGCRLQIEASKGGSISTYSGTYGCAASSICKIDIKDDYFDETFIANPEPGYVFLGWEKKFKSFCGGSNKPCHLATTGFSEYENLMSLLETDEVFYLTPIFVKGTPLDESLNNISDDVLRECIQEWARGAVYAEEVTEARCIDYSATVESIDGLESFIGLEKLMLNAWKYPLTPLGALKQLKELRLYVHPDADLAPLGHLAVLNRLELGIFRKDETCNKYANTEWRCRGIGFTNFGALANLVQLNFLNLYFDNPNLRVIGKLGNLKTLHLSSNEITDISPLHSLTKLAYLSLENNNIRDISALGSLKRLETIQLSRNQISDISALANLNNLFFVFLGENKISDISALRGKELGTLSLSNNLIVDISPLDKLRHPGVPPNNILVLGLSNNRIRVIEGALDSIEKGYVYLDGNPIPCSEIEEYVETKPIRVDVHFADCGLP